MNAAAIRQISAQSMQIRAQAASSCVARSMHAVAHAPQASMQP